jgi:hypothetical protein
MALPGQQPEPLPSVDEHRATILAALARENEGDRAAADRERAKATGDYRRALEELSLWHRKCPWCFELTVKVCDCPIEGPGEGGYCTNCGKTHLDGIPLPMIQRLETELTTAKARIAELKAEKARLLRRIAALNHGF